MADTAVEIREATPADAERLAAVYRSAYAENRDLGFPASAGSATAPEVSGWIEATTVLVAVVDTGGYGTPDVDDGGDGGGNDDGDSIGDDGVDGEDDEVGDDGSGVGDDDVGDVDGVDGEDDDVGDDGSGVSDVDVADVDVDSTVVGGVRLTEVDADHGKISRFGVHEAWKGRGIGGALLAHAEAVCRERGDETVRLTTPGEHPVLPDLYRARGYEKTGDYPLEYREYDEIVMEKPLGDASLSSGAGR